MRSSRMRPRARLTPRVDSEQSLPKWTKRETFTRSRLHPDNSRITKNYSPFLLEASATVWGMDFFNDYLKGQRFILYMEHKPLEKLGHLHCKMLNRLQTALLEHEFVIQYIKGSNMPADYLSRLPGAKDIQEPMASTHL